MNKIEPRNPFLEGGAGVTATGIGLPDLNLSSYRFWEPHGSTLCDARPFPGL
jgi:hypothetical protein